MLDQSIRSWNPWWAQKMPPSLTGIRKDITEDIIISLGTTHIKDIIFLNFDDPSINKKFYR